MKVELKKNGKFLFQLFVVALVALSQIYFVYHSPRERQVKALAIEQMKANFDTDVVIDQVMEPSKGKYEPAYPIYLTINGHVKRDKEATFHLNATCDEQNNCSIETNSILMSGEFKQLIQTW